MQISKINANMSFNGLWTFEKNGVVFNTKKRQEEQQIKAVYHPFKDETPEEIEEALTKEKENTVYEYWYDGGDPYEPEEIVRIKHSVGERLNITSDEYEKLSEMKKTGHPESDYMSSWRWHPEKNK